MQKETYRYADGAVECEGLIVRKANLQLPAPVVVVCHHWSGRDALMDQRAEEVAQLGYIALAADLYGNHRTSQDREVCASMMNPFMAGRAMLRERLRATVSAAARMPGADGRKIVVMGFCFGGLCALDAARAGLPGVVGVASFHGLFTPPELGAQKPINARVLALHGFDDPLAPPDALRKFTVELNDAKARWEIDAYGQTVHAFTNPAANDKAAGMAFDPVICARSFARLEGFLKECFAA